QKRDTEEPKVNIKVNKRFDAKGNIISYDSTYTSYYSTKKQADKHLMDSLIKKFKPMITEQFPFVNDRYMNNLFFTDSLLSKDFFHEDFFRKRLELNELYMNKMMQKMDSVKNEFFKAESKKLKK
ncbi:MAG: hypothetical protein Q8T03_01220, partial [Bacteroidota bacterium]|nr:hypothetical protein [Bacteroidota bacterium]